MGHRARFLILGVAAAAAAVAVKSLSDDDANGGPRARASPGAARPPDLAAEPSNAGLRAELRAVHGTVQQLAATQASLQREIEGTATERAAAEAAREAATAAARVESEDPAAADRAASELASHCDATIRDEPVDLAWSRTKTEQFAGFFARPPLTGTKLNAVDCRTTMCRLELAAHSQEDRARFIQSFSDLAGPTGMVFAHIETDEDLEIVVYVTRDGVGLP